jgi:hypothetical protein
MRPLCRARALRSPEHIGMATASARLRRAVVGAGSDGDSGSDWGSGIRESDGDSEGDGDSDDVM